MSRRSNRALWALLCVLVISVAGCGGGSTLSKSAYRAKLKKALVTDLGAALRPLQTSASAKGYEKLVSAAQPKLRKIADDLNSVKPPKEVQHDNDLIVRSLKKFADALTPLKEAAKKHDKAAIQAAIQKIGTSQFTKDLRTAVADLTKKGYAPTAG